MEAQALKIKSSRCSELLAELTRFNSDRHRAEMRESAKRNEITNKEGEILRQENQVARLEPASMAPGAGRQLPPPARVPVGIVGAVTHVQLVVAKRRLERLRSIELPRLKDELRLIERQVDTIGDNIRAVVEKRRQLGCP